MTDKDPICPETPRVASIVANYRIIISIERVSDRRRYHLRREVEVMLAVESAYCLTVPDAELNPTNFMSAASIAGLMMRLKHVNQVQQEDLGTTR